MSKNKTEIHSEDKHGQVFLYQTEDGDTRIEVKFENETVWLTQAQMAELFDKGRSTVAEHIKHIFEEHELVEETSCRKFRQHLENGRIYEVLHYNLDVIISVGYRVKSHRGTQFRIWATKRLKEYIVKGFTIDDERLKRAGEGNYFDELLRRIRDIRSSEKMFWRKVLEIYATSIDYDSKTDSSKKFFATIQNKMHWAAHGNTAAEVIHDRVDHKKNNMGLTSWASEHLNKSDVTIAKNYLNEKELDVLNRIVTLYLDFAELQALEQKPMYMKDWITKLDDFLKLSNKQILTHTGKITHEMAKIKAETEYDKYKALKGPETSLAEIHFEESLKEVKAIEQKRKKDSGK